MFIEDANHTPSRLRDIGDLSVPGIVGELQIALHAGAGVLVVAGETMGDLSEALEELAIEASRQFPDLSCVLFTPEHPDGAIGALEEALRALLGRPPEETNESPPWEIVEASLLRGHLPDASPRLLVVDRFRELFHESEPDVSRFCRSLSRCARLERMSVVVGVIREDLDKLRAIAGLLPSLQPAFLPIASPAPLPTSVTAAPQPVEPTFTPARGSGSIATPEPELILEPTHIWESGMEMAAEPEPEPLLVREIEPLPEAFFQSDVLQAWNADPVRHTAPKTGRKRTVHVFELLLVSTAIALLVYFLPLRESAPVATPAPAPAPTELSSIPEVSAAPRAADPAPSSKLIPVSGLPKETPVAKTPDAKPVENRSAAPPAPQKPATPVAAPAPASKPVQTSASVAPAAVTKEAFQKPSAPPAPPKPLSAPATQPQKPVVPPPAPVASAPPAVKPSSAPAKKPAQAQAQAVPPKPTKEPVSRPDPVRRLVTELKQSPPATFGDVAILADKISQSEAEAARQDFQNFLAARFFCEDHLPLAMGQLFADARVNDAATANKWFQHAVDRDLAGGMTQIGVSHLLGRGVPQNTEEGYRWLVRARSKNDGAGAFLAALCRIRGTGATQNLPMARELLNVAIDHKCLEAYWESSWMYEEGLGGPTDRDWAFHLCRLGAAQRETKCLERLARHYDSGDLVPKDPKKAAECRTAAATARPSWLRDVASRTETLPLDHPAPAPAAETGAAVPLAWLQHWYERTQTSFVRSLAGWYTAAR